MSNKNKLGQEPAFPEVYEYPNHSGMSKRFYAACAAMQGLLASWDIYSMPEQKGIEAAVSCAYECADELLKQENE